MTIAGSFTKADFDEPAYTFILTADDVADSEQISGWIVDGSIKPVLAKLSASQNYLMPSSTLRVEEPEER